MRPCSFVVSLCLSCACGIGAPAGAQSYHIIALPDGSSPTGINESGDTTGYLLDNQGIQAFVSEPNGTVEVIPGTPATSNGFGIAGGGPKGSWPEEEDKRKLRITGSAVFNPNSGIIFFPLYQAFLYEDHFLRNLGTLPGGSNSAGESVNSSGEVAGFSDALAVVFKHGNVISLGTLKGDSASSASGINNFGDVTGVSSSYGPPLIEHAFLYHDGRMMNLGTLPGATQASGTAVNDAMQVVGTAFSNDFSFEHAFLWSKGKMKDLGTLPEATFSGANSINVWGQIVGVSSVQQGTGIHAFLYSDDHMKDLNDMIPSNSGWELNNATGINDRGEITGTGTVNGFSRGFILTLDCNDSRNRDCDSCRHNR